MSFNYIVTAHKATAVTITLAGSFTGPDDLNLLQARGSTLAVSQVTPEGLKPVINIDVFGRISAMQLFRPKNEKQDLLFLLTARYHVAILSFDSIQNDVITRAYGDVKDRVGKPTSGKQVALVDPNCQAIVLHLYAGLLKVVPLQFDSHQSLKAFNLRLDDLYIVDMQFIHSTENLTIAYLVEEPNGRVLKTSIISVRDKELLNGPHPPVKTEAQANLLWPISDPHNGMLVIGMESIAYYNAEAVHSIDPPVIKDSIISCVGTVDMSRYLIGDSRGRLLMLFLDFKEDMECEEPLLISMKLEILGEISSPYTLSYLDNGVIFIGSAMGDSQLVKLCSTPGADGSFVEVMENITNIAPIVDMSVTDLDKQGRDVLVCCSGVGKDGSLRIIKSGIGIHEAASIDLPNVKGIWSLQCGTENNGFDNIIILSFVGQTIALSLNGEEIEETDLSGIVTDQQTFYCANVIAQCIIQITSKSVRLINQESLEMISEWVPPDGRGISTMACNASQVVVAVGCDLYYMEVKPSSPAELIQLSQTTMSYEVACLDINLCTSDPKSSLCAVGLWTDISVQILSLPHFEELYTQPLAGDIIPRSILMVVLGEVCYLLCALGDGCLYYYIMNPQTGQLSSSKRVVLGTKPIVLRLFQSNGIVNVFACSDHPTIIHSSNQKLLFSNVNVKEVNYMCMLNSEAFQDSLALVDGNSLVLGSVDQIQMLHIETIPLGESPRCIAYQESSKSFLVGTYRIEKLAEDGTNKTTPTRQSISTMSGNLTVGLVPPRLVIDEFKQEEVEIHSLLLMDQNTFEVSHVFQLSPQEHVLSIASCTLTLPDEDKIVYVVGTALVRPEEKEATVGRILIFQANGNKLELLCQKIEEGAVYQVRPFNGKILNSVNSSIYLYKLTDDMNLHQECSYKNNILALYLKTKGDFVLVGDILRSLKLLVYREEEHVLEEIAVDHNISPCFCTSIELIDDENYIACDGRHVFICQKNTEAIVEAEMKYMVQPSRMYLGDNINVFSRGSFVMDHPGISSTLLQGKPLLYGTVHGAIGLIGQLNNDTYSILSALQQKMVASIKSVGNIEHEIYRSFSNEHRSKPYAGFIDGDLIEKFLDLPRMEMLELSKGIKMIDVQGMEVDATVDDVLKLIEDLSRLH